MSNKLSDEELLEIASHSPKSGNKYNKEYNIGKSSIDNYVNLCIKYQAKEDVITKRIPIDLAYMHYCDWLSLTRPEVMPHNLYTFRKEILLLVNHVIDNDTNYLLVNYTKQYRSYKDHPYNKMLMERERELNVEKCARYRKRVKDGKPRKKKKKLYFKSSKPKKSFY